MKLGLAPACLLLLCACGSATPQPSAGDPAPVPTTAPPTQATPPATPPAATPPPPAPPPVTPPTLKVSWLGVQGFLLELGDQAVLTAPLFTRPDMISVSTGVPVESDQALVEASLPTARLANVRTIVSGHAHYDHLLDVPNVMSRQPLATLYSNTSAKNLLDAFAPDRAPTCSGDPAPSIAIDRARVVAMDDPAASVVDWTNCPSMKPAGASYDGKWVTVPGASVRVYAVCSMHPDQIAPGIHFAPGDVDTAQCEPPDRADAWKEGPTLAFLVDFLDAKSGAPSFRVYYQDAPTEGPIGYVPPSVLADHRIDLALLNIGSYDRVDNQPTDSIAALVPRYALGGHWEDFFQPMSANPAPIPFLDTAKWTSLATTAMPVAAEPKAMLQNGAAATA
ncbi:MAG TPA: hypothetical protein VIF62_02985, partial [Labilithrix sp.]